MLWSKRLNGDLLRRRRFISSNWDDEDWEGTCLALLSLPVVPLARRPLLARAAATASAYLSGFDKDSASGTAAATETLFALIPAGVCRSLARRC